MRSLAYIRFVVILGLATFCSRMALSIDGELFVNEARLTQRLDGLSHYGRNADGGVDRVAYSAADIAGRDYIKGLMEEAGLGVRVDAAGNIIGRWEGNVVGLPPILFGSHIDSVPGGGNYDGDVGVIAAIEVAQVLHETGYTPRYPLEVIVFADEEGGLVGSRAMIGHMTDAALAVISHSKVSVAEGIRRLGGDPGRLRDAERKPGDIKAFIELHIEQGAVLDDKDIDIGVVEGIVGIKWWDVTIIGTANHAGTTPMNKRRDAMLAAARLVLAINHVVTRQPGGQVGTVGRINAEPGAPNVIPGRVTMSLEIRDLAANQIRSLYEQIVEQAKDIATTTGTEIRFAELDVASPPAPTDPRMRDIIADVTRKLGYSHQRMSSGAGHDAQDMALIAPTGMIFVPSVGGVSHAPGEYTTPRDVANGANVLLHTILAIDAGALD